MADGTVLELLSLPDRHPYGWGLLDRFGMPTAYRLGYHPVHLPRGMMEREVVVDWVARSATPPIELRRVIGWRGLPNVEQVCPQLRWTVNERHLTEFAACGVMALLIHDLEGETILNVLEIGDGPDYLIYRGKTESVTAVEVSGMLRADPASQSRTRVREKRGELLGTDEHGFVSVTAFSRPPGETVYSHLHFVTRSAGKRG